MLSLLKLAGEFDAKLRMRNFLDNEQVKAYARDGYIAPIRVFAVKDACDIRHQLETVEKKDGGKLALSLRFKPHLLYPFLDELIRLPTVLDAVESLIGPNILCWASSIFSKAGGDGRFVSWHQDSTYWGLSEANCVTAWIALSASTRESGCMRFVAGSHKLGQLRHVDTLDPANMLSRGQAICNAVDEDSTVYVPLEPGEMSLHHVRLIHGSEPNRSLDPRIGFAVRYIPPHVRQLNGSLDTAMLVRGEDRCHNFELEPRPSAELHPDAVAFHARAVKLGRRRSAAVPYQPGASSQ